MRLITVLVLCAILCTIACPLCITVPIHAGGRSTVLCKLDVCRVRDSAVSVNAVSSSVILISTVLIELPRKSLFQLCCDKPKLSLPYYPRLDRPPEV